MALFVSGSPLLAAQGGRGRSAPPTARGSYNQGVRGQLGTRPGGEHLAQWMNQHSNLSLPEQQRALEREPGFRQLPSGVQQRMRDRLTQLNSMTPERRQRVLAHTEAIERLSPEQRQAFRGTMQQLSSLPPERRRAVSQAFREYRSLPGDQRASLLRSGRLTSGFSPDERSTFNDLVQVEPFLPPPVRPKNGLQPYPGAQPSYSGDRQPGDFPQEPPRNGFQRSQPEGTPR